MSPARILVALFILIAMVPVPASACTVSLTLSDVTDYSTRVGRDASELRHPYAFRALAPGSQLTVVRAYSSFLPFPGITTRCDSSDLNPQDCTLELWCPRPGTYEIAGSASCSSATTVRERLQLVVSDDMLSVEIRKIEPISSGQYDVHAVLSVPPGATIGSSSNAVYPLLPDGTFGEPRWISSHIIEASPGDKVRTTVNTCNNRVVSAESIVPPPPSIEVAVLDGNEQRAVVGEPAERPLRVKFTASDPSLDLTTIPAVFEVISAPPAATGHGVGPNDAAIAQTYSAAVGLTASPPR